MTLLLMGSGEAVVLLCRRYLVREDLIEVGVKGRVEPNNLFGLGRWAEIIYLAGRRRVCGSRCLRSLS